MSESEAALKVDIRDAVAHVRFDRPAIRNAFDDGVAAELARTFTELGARDDLRAVVLGGEGEVFCAGGDLNWMRRVADYTREENFADAEAFPTGLHQRAVVLLTDGQNSVNGADAYDGQLSSSELNDRTRVSLPCAGPDGEPRECNSTEDVLRGFNVASERVGIRGALERVIERFFGGDES